EASPRYWAGEYHALAGNLALGVVAVGFLFAWSLYYRRSLDPGEAKEQFPAVYRFLDRKWYFDELYSVALVRPVMVVAQWCRTFDLKVIDWFVDGLATATVRVSKWDGRFDNGVIDGIANLFATVAFGIAGRLRRVQTGYLRSYILFLALAALVLFVLVTYFVSTTTAGG